ncbi:hypothetical protein LINPERPRIM_LOCUS29301 [Linum perenne]
MRDSNSTSCRKGYQFRLLVLPNNTTLWRTERAEDLVSSVFYY